MAQSIKNFVLLRRTTERCLNLLAKQIQAVDINRVQIHQNQIYKQRCWWGWLLILIGNPVLACRSVPVSVLSTNQWIQWEQRVNKALRDESIPDGRVFVCQRLPGVAVAQWLGSLDDETLPDQTLPAKLKVVQSAISGLQQLHTTDVTTRQGKTIRLSHGDATISNIFYDESSGAVNWFDFDLRHWLGYPATQRHADDLRAFLFSAAVHFSTDELPEFLAQMKRHYNEQAVWECLTAQLSSHWFRFDVFHLAQIRRGLGRLNLTTHEIHHVNERFKLLENLILNV